MNRRARARYGRGADNTHMDDWASIYHLCDPLTGEPLERENIPLVRALRGEQVLNAEIMMLTPDHQKHYVLINCGPLYDDHGNLLGAVAVSFDISERRRMEHELRQINAQLEATNKELESFSYSISHDLRSPLRAIEGFTQVLQEDYAEQFDEEGRRLLQIVRNNSQRMGELINDLLAFSRLGRAAIKLVKIDMNALVKDICDEIGLTGGELRVDLIRKTLPAIRADYSLLRQVWLNLLTNAVKFSSAKEHPRIEIGAIGHDGEVVYYVRDNGAGFDMRYYNKLFGVFQRLHSHEEFPGTGVGLAIVQRVVSRHNGRVWAESKLDEGTVFYFSLPVGD
jgi:light-regulated signal transduction histidine kinase (bacteriophytochrome)